MEDAAFSSKYYHILAFASGQLFNGLVDAEIIHGGTTMKTQNNMTVPKTSSTLQQ